MAFLNLWVRCVCVCVDVCWVLKNYLCYLYDDDDGVFVLFDIFVWQM